MCNSIVTGKDENYSLIYTWLNILVILEAEGNWNGLSILHHHAVEELAAKILKIILRPADALVYFCLVLHGDSSPNLEASCSSTGLIISESAMHLRLLEPDEQLAEISVPIVCDKECVCFLSWKESSADPKSCHSVLPWGRQH